MKARNIFTWLLALVLVVVGSLATTSCGPTATVEEEKVFKFAHLDGFSGEAAAWAWMSQTSMEIAVEDIEASGGLVVGGERYKIEIVKYDHAWDPSIAYTLAKKIIYKDGIKYIHVDSDEEVLAILDLTNQEKVILLPICGDLDYIDEAHPYTWLHYPLPLDSMEMMFEYCAEAHPEYHRTIGIYPDSAAGYLDDEDLTEATAHHGWEMLDSVFIPHGAPDFYGTLTPILTKEPDVIELGLTPPGQQAVIIKQARELGYDGIFMFSDTMDVAYLTEMCGIEAIEGSIASPQFVDFPTDTGKRWAERFTARYGSLQGWCAWEYDYFMLLRKAIEKADTFDTEKVNEAMDEVTFDGVFGPTMYKSQDERFLVFKDGVVEIIDGEATDVYLAYPPRMRD